MEEKNNLEFKVLFWGNFIPLQGIEYIIRAAKILESEADIKFEIIGSGQTYNQIITEAKETEIKNIDFISKLPLQEIPNFIKKADVCLGIFGNTAKAQRVIPNKVYEAIAMKKPVISGDTPAIRELFADRENILLCKTANPEDLADKILELKNNENLRKKIAGNGYILFRQKATPAIVVGDLIAELKKINSG